MKSERTFKDCLSFVNDVLELGMVPEQLVVILQNNKSLYGALVEWGIDDTEVKGQLVNKISMAYMDRSWPTYGDDIDVDEFTENLRKKISEVPGMV